MTEPDLLARLGAEPGLCATCIHRELVGGRGGTYLRCRLSDTDPCFPRYPRLPVLECDGYRPEGEERGARARSRDPA